MSELSKNNEILKDNELDEVSGGLEGLLIPASEKGQPDASEKAPKAMRRAQLRSRLPFKLAVLRDDEKLARLRAEVLRSKRCL